MPFDELTQMAVVGTARATGSLNADHPADVLVSGFEEDRETSLLLLAACRSIHEHAGRVATETPPDLEPAPKEPHQVVSSKLEALFLTALEPSFDRILLEVAPRMRDLGLVLPHGILADVLSLKPGEVRDALEPVLGTRGVWLAASHPRGAWVRERQVHGIQAQGDVQELERIWHEGTLIERVSALRTWRARDPARSRELALTDLAREKADDRARILEAFEIGLTNADEDALENLLDDRSQKVRSVVAGLSMKLAGSAFLERRRRHAERILALETRAGEEVLFCSPPQELDDEAVRDSLRQKPPQGTGKRAFYTSQILGFVHPNHFCDLFGKSPGALLQATSKDRFQDTILLAWTTFLQDRDAPDHDLWAEALWVAWRRRFPAGPKTLPLSALTLLLRGSKQAIAERHLTDLMRDPAAPIEKVTLLHELAEPWSSTFSKTCLTFARRALETASHEATAYAHALETLAFTIHPDMLSQALEPIHVSEQIKAYDKTAAHRAVRDFTHIVSLRAGLLNGLEEEKKRGSEG